MINYKINNNIHHFIGGINTINKWFQNLFHVEDKFNHIIIITKRLGYIPFIRENKMISVELRYIHITIALKGT